MSPHLPCLLMFHVSSPSHSLHLPTLPTFQLYTLNPSLLVCSKSVGLQVIRRLASWDSIKTCQTHPGWRRLGRRILAEQEIGWISSRLSARCFTVCSAPSRLWRDSTWVGAYNLKSPLACPNRDRGESELAKTMRFGISLAVRSLVGVPISKFTFWHVPALDRHGVDVVRDGILQNLVSREDQLTNGSTPWRGPREKSVLLMQIFIQSASDPGDVVIDCIAATGSSIHACRNVDRHIVALEVDVEIFKALLQPLIRSSVVHEVTFADRGTSEDREGEVIAIEKIVKKSRFNKSGNLSYPIHRSFICDPNFYPSPPKSWHLPTYANDAAIQLADGAYRSFKVKNPTRWAS